MFFKNFTAYSSSEKKLREIRFLQWTSSCTWKCVSLNYTLPRLTQFLNNGQLFRRDILNCVAHTWTPRYIPSLCKHREKKKRISRFLKNFRCICIMQCTPLLFSRSKFSSHVRCDGPEDFLHIPAIPRGSRVRFFSRPFVTSFFLLCLLFILSLCFEDILAVLSYRKLKKMLEYYKLAL